MPGPLPDPDAVRRNAATIPTTKLPAGGRRGAVQAPPAWRDLGPAGMSWWAWAWRTPQACAWDDGQLVKVADRASLEDDLIAVRRASEVDDFLRDVGRADDLRELKSVVMHLASLVTGRLSILTKISELDDRLGLSPKGRDALRLKIVADEVYYPKSTTAAKSGAPAKVTKLTDRRRRSVDAS
jgi:hypothetical protein